MFKESYKIKDVLGKWVILEQKNGFISGFDCSQVVNFTYLNPHETEEFSKCRVILLNDSSFIIDITLSSLFELLKIS